MDNHSIDLRPSDAGMTSDHIRAVARQCQVDNVFLFVRPSTDDTRRLIEEGFATKSMDIHDKSSDWGPMAGLVPIDPEFSKKPPGRPYLLDPFQVHGHNQAHPTQLVISTGMMNTMIGRKLGQVDNQGYVLFAPLSTQGKPILRYAPFDMGAAPPAGFWRVGSSHFRLFKAISAPTHAGYSVLFLMVRASVGWRVYWVAAASQETPGSKATPLGVWAYHRNGGLTAVTGDYDLWMVAPHLSMTAIELHHAVSIRPDAHGQSAVSGYTSLLLGRLNHACNRSDNPVFNHGAESQNVGFTQAHDPKLVMFTPSGRARMVKMRQMPGILGDLHKTGYIVTLNKQWGSADPVLGGKSLQRREEALAAARAQKKDEATLKALLSDVDKTRQSVQEMQNWYRQLQRSLESHGDRALKGLQSADLPQGYHVASEQMRRASYDIQKTLLGLVRDQSGGGDAGAIVNERWFDWQNRNRSLLQSIRDYWGMAH